MTMRAYLTRAAYLVLGVALGLLLAPQALAQSVSKQLQIAWTLPTVSVEGVPLTGANAITGVELFIATSPIPDTATTPTLTVGAVQSAQHTLSVTNGQTVYVRAKSVRGTEKSALSTQASVVIALSTVPGVPTSVTITVLVSP